MAERVPWKASTREPRQATIRDWADFQWHLTWANAGKDANTHSMYLVARAYEISQFGPGDQKEAEYIVAKGREGYTIGWNNQQEALKWYRKAAEGGHPWAQRQMGYLSEEPTEKFHWLYEAFMSGDSGDDDFVQLSIARILILHGQTQKHRTEAIRLLKLSNHPGAKRLLKTVVDN